MYEPKLVEGLIKARKAAGLTQRQAAELGNIPYATLTYIEATKNVGPRTRGLVEALIVLLRNTSKKTHAKRTVATV
jgi:transcriptional regulator with XRE-family HTH domain